jgi:hypothetical protein
MEFTKYSVIKVSKGVKNIKLSHQAENTIDAIKLLLDVYAATNVPYHNRLTSKERDYYATCVYLFNKGVDIISKTAVDYLEKTLNFDKKNKGVYIYRNRLKDKNWLIQTVDGLAILPVFMCVGKTTDGEYFIMDIDSPLQFNLQIDVDYKAMPKK